MHREWHHNPSGAWIKMSSGAFRIEPCGRDQVHLLLNEKSVGMFSTDLEAKQRAESMHRAAISHSQQTKTPGQSG